MRDGWQRRIDRASALAAGDEATRPLLEAYGRLLMLQRDCEASFDRQAGSLSGSLERDLSTVAACVPPVLAHVCTSGPPSLAEEARRILDQGEAEIQSMLVAEWRAPSDQNFFARIVLQPYASWLAARGMVPVDRDLPRHDNLCPFCGGRPQVSILQHAPEGEGGGRQLQCGTCFTTWSFRRVRCVHCGEEEERQLGYFRSERFEHLRVDACETCKRYVKSVDLTRLGFAVPIVDEVAGAPLDLWANERGYEKVELNLIGL
jgi:FdhE protein